MYECVHNAKGRGECEIGKNWIKVVPSYVKGEGGIYCYLRTAPDTNFVLSIFHVRTNSGLKSFIIHQMLLMLTVLRSK